MALSEEETEFLKERAQQVGSGLGLNLRFETAPNPEFVGVTAHGTFVVGPDRVDAVTVLDFEMTLDAIESGAKVVLFDDWDGDGDIYPRLWDQKT